jgi:hypothetical protein
LRADCDELAVRGRLQPAIPPDRELELDVRIP